MGARFAILTYSLRSWRLCGAKFNRRDAENAKKSRAISLSASI